MGWLQAIRRSLFSLSGSTYDAVHAKNKRQAPTGILRSEDSELPPTERRKLLSATRTLHRNLSVTAWMIHKHQDYVSTFSFQARTGNNELDDSLERQVRWSQPANFDVTGRFGFQRFTRLIVSTSSLEARHFSWSCTWGVKLHLSSAARSCGNSSSSIASDPSADTNYAPVGQIGEHHRVRDRHQ